MANEIVIPRLGWTMEEGTFVRWIKNHGDYVHRGDPLFELEGEKASQEIESIDEGILHLTINGPKPGDVLKVGAVIGLLMAKDEQPTINTPSMDSPALSDSQQTAKRVAGPSVRRLAREMGVDLADVRGSGTRGRILAEDIHRSINNESNQSDPTHSAPTANAQTVPSAYVANLSSTQSNKVASPRARRVAAELGIDWHQLTGTGARGRVRESDVRDAANRTSSIAETGNTRIPISSRRRTIAQRMVISRQQTVPVTLTTKADASNLVNLREQLKSASSHNIIPSYQDIIMKLVTQSLQAHPIMSGRWDENGIIVCDREQIHLGMAVDTEEGLLVPVVRDVNRLTLQELAIKSRQLAELARAGKLLANDMAGSVFTITNLGAYGIDAFTPVINYPEVAILGLGAIRREPQILDDGRVVPQSQITLSLTFDHRVVDGAPAAKFLQSIVQMIANPSAYLLLASNVSSR